MKHMKRLIVFLSILLITLTTLAMTASAATKVTEVKVLGVEPPVATNTPDETAYVTSFAYSVYSQPEWYDKTDGYFLEPGDVFIKGHVYEVNVWIEVNDGYAFATKQNGSPDVVAYIDGNKANAYKAYEYQGFAMVDVRYTFEPCPSKSITHLDIQLNMGLTELEEGTYAPFSFTCTTAQIQANPSLNYDRYYPSGVYWSNLTASSRIYNGDKFKGGYDYYVELAIAPLYGSHTFAEGMTVNINGKEATIKLRGDSHAIVGAEFTCFGSIYHYDVNPHVILPKAGNTPDYEPAYYYPQCNHIQYACINGWYDAESGERLTRDDKFEAGKSYTVEIECMANYPYRFLRDSNDKMKYPPYVSGMEADSYSFGYNDYYGRETIILKKTFTVEGAVHKHTASSWRTTGAYHYTVCTVCGDMLDQEDHLGGVATCTEKGKCTVCGYAYLEENENHTPSTEWSSCGSLYHAQLCTKCGAHCNPEDHVPGAEATDNSPQVCTVCQYVIAPAKNHVHELTRVPAKDATCTDEGNAEYYFCSGCGGLFSDAEGQSKLTSIEKAPLGHTASDSWSCDKDFHWRTCTACSAVLDETKMAHGMQDGKCTTCGYATDAAVTTPADSDTATDTAAADTDEGGIPSWVWLCIGIGGGLALVVIIGIAVMLILKKNKAKGETKQ